MEKSVLISIRPQWCEKIASREKTLELRKSVPKEFVKNSSEFKPFKCYIYCTLYGPVLWLNNKLPINARVIGWFTCDSIVRHCEFENIAIAERDSLVTKDRILKYANGKEVLGWHISDLMVYDHPRKLEEFCLSRPPQSWCYVEEEKF